MRIVGAILEKALEPYLHKVVETAKKLLGRSRDATPAASDALLQAIRRAQLESIRLVQQEHREELGRQFQKRFADDLAFIDALDPFLDSRLKTLAGWGPLRGRQSRAMTQTPLAA